MIEANGGEVDDALVGSLADAYRTLWAPLVRLALMLCGSRELAEDIVQQVFADVHHRWSLIDDPPAYLRRAVTFRVRDTYRQATRRQQARALLGSPVHLAEPDLDETWAVVLRLPPRQREVLILRFYADLSLVDIATLVGRPPATIRSLLRRGLANLRKGLS